MEGARESVLMVLLRGASLGLAAVSGILLARLLAPAEYSLYQVVFKRVLVYATLPSALFGFWAYRYVAAGRQGSLTSFMAVALASPLAAVALITALVGPSPGGLLLGLALGALAYSLAVSRVASSVRPVRSQAWPTAHRLTFVALVVALVWWLGLGLVGAAFAVLLSSLAVIIVEVKDLRAWLRGFCSSCIREWLRGLGPPALQQASALLLALDVFIVMRYGSQLDIASFFAATLPVLAVSEVVSAGFQHVHAKVLTSGGAGPVLGLGRLLVYAGALPLGYFASRPDQVVSLVNPLYLGEASRLLPVMAFYSMTHIMAVYSLSVAYGLDPQAAASPGRAIRALSLSQVAASGLYAAALALMLYLGLPVIASWYASRALHAVVLLIAALALTPPAHSASVARGVVLPGYAYLALSALIAWALAPGGYSEAFVENLALMLAGALVTAPPYLLVALADPALRSSVAETARQARGLLRRW